MATATIEKKKELKIEKTLHELELEHKELRTTVENYLMVLGIDHMMIDEVIEDLKSQMYMHADRNVNDLIADLINLENEIAIKRKKEEAESEGAEKQY